MIRSKLGIPFRSLKKAVERLFCGFLAVLVLFVNATAPVRAAGTLATITGAAVVSAWLMACGIYPYISEDGQTFGEWGAQQLQDLADQYAATDPIGDFGLSEFTGFITGKTIAIAKGSWEKLRAFANWIVSQFSVTDNSYGDSLIIGKMTFQTNIGPVFYTEFDVPLNGLVVNKADVSWTSAFETLSLIFRTVNNGSDNGYVLGTEGSYTSLPFPSGATYQVNNGASFIINGVYHTANFTRFNPCVFAFGLYDERLYIASVYENDTSETFRFDTSYSWPISSIQTAKSGDLTVDTTKVSIPAELPETATYGGLTVPDAISGTAPAITDVIEQGVTDRTQPLVVPTVVEIPADAEITDDGTITENPVVVTPEMALPSVADLSLPASVIASFKTKFPFCLPWDIMAFFQPLSVTPQAPVIVCNIPDPFTGETYTISVDLSPWDSVAAIVRHFESVIIAVGFALGFRKFVLIGAHS